MCQDVVLTSNVSSFTSHVPIIQVTVANGIEKHSLDGLSGSSNTPDSCAFFWIEILDDVYC